MIFCPCSDGLFFNIYVHHAFGVDMSDNSLRLGIVPEGVIDAVRRRVDGCGVRRAPWYTPGSGPAGMFCRILHGGRIRVKRVGWHGDDGVHHGWSKKL